MEQESKIWTKFQRTIHFLRMRMKCYNNYILASRKSLLELLHVSLTFSESIYLTELLHASPIMISQFYTSQSALVQINCRFYILKYSLIVPFYTNYKISIFSRFHVGCSRDKMNILTDMKNKIWGKRTMCFRNQSKTMLFLLVLEKKIIIKTKIIKFI